jgi:Skp family chaperone for outer membrane proteins
MTSAIEFIAESEGYSVILNKASNLFLFFVPEVDITDLVIAELSRRASR